LHERNSLTLFQKSKFRGRPGVVIGTGPSLDLQAVKESQKRGAVLFGINNTFKDFDLDVWIACDPQWHDHYSPVKGDFHKWHWDKQICETYGYQYIPGKWGEGPNRCDGLSLDPNYIAYGHSSGFQALNLALHYGCDPIFLVGYDMHYQGKRHYFETLSDKAGEYPEKLRKYSTFDGLITCYEQVAKQGLNIINTTKDSALKCFKFDSLLNPKFYGQT